MGEENNQGLPLEGDNLQPQPGDPGASQPEGQTASQPGEQTPTQEEKKFTQEELDAIVEKRLAKERRKIERKAQPPQPIKPPQGELRLDQFNSPEEYAEALAERRTNEKIEQQSRASQHQQMVESYQEREEEAREKYEDFEAVAYNPALQISDVMALAIQASDIGPDVAYHLGKNPKEAARIAKMPPLLQAREIGKIEATLSANPPQPTPKPSNAPPPITPISKPAASQQYDTTDPRSTKTMSTSEWIEAERQRQIRILEARQ